MAGTREIVITGVGIVSPIGIGSEAFWASLSEGRSGVRLLDVFDGDALPAPIGGAVADFEPKRYIRPRKSLKVMSRDIQLGFAAADLACTEAEVRQKPLDPERFGIVFGAEMIPCDATELVDAYRACIDGEQFDFNRWGNASMTEMYPLWMLKYLPNMPACHVGIAQDARGPNNSITLGDVSSLSAIAEAMRVIERGHADAMLAGGTGTRINPALFSRSEVYELSQRVDDPESASRPFDARRDGMINAEGAGTFMLESRGHAERRGAKVLARILGYASAFEPKRNGHVLEGRAIRKAITGVLAATGVEPNQIDHVNANGSSTIHDDQIEAQAIRDVLGDVPVTAPKSFFGNLGAGSGAVEMAVSVMAFDKGVVAPTLNYETPDPDCPVNVVRDELAPLKQPVALVLNHTTFGQAVAMLVAAEDG